MSPFIKFLITGGIAALINIGSRILLSIVMPFEMAVLLAYAIGMVVAYALARRFVFAPSGNSRRTEFIRFGLVNLVGLAQVFLVSIALANWLFPAIGFTWNAELLAHTIAVLSPVWTSFYGHMLFSFRPPGGRKAP